MNTILVLFAFLGLVSASFSGVDLTNDNFKEIVDGSTATFVEFFAPWCGHCKRLAPEYDVVADHFAGNAKVTVARIDCDEHKDACGEHGVRGYPTLKFWGKGASEFTDYQGGRTSADIISYIEENSGSAGRIESLDVIAAKFTGGDQEALITEAQQTIEGLEGDDVKFGKFYVKVMTTLKEKPDFVKTETERLNKMIKGGSLTALKKGEFSARVNILDAFSTE